MAERRDVDGGIGPPGEPHLGDALVDLVLGDVDSDRRAAMAAHVMRCALCRREYDELAAIVAELLPAVPGVQPPIRFDERALARLAGDPQGQRDSTGAGSSRRWRWLAAAAAAVLVAVLAPIGVWMLGRDDDPSPVGGEVATLRLTGDDSPVGTVSVSQIAGDAVMVVAIVDAPEGVSYYCRARFADGTTADSEAWPSGSGAWIVPLPSGGEVTTVDVLPAGTDKIWSSATFT